MGYQNCCPKKRAIFSIIGWHIPSMYLESWDVSACEWSASPVHANPAVWTKAQNATQKAGILLAYHYYKLHGIYKVCQYHRNFIRQSSEPLHATTHSWPFESWDIDIVWPFEKVSPETISISWPPRTTSPNGLKPSQLTILRCLLSRTSS